MSEELSPFERMPAELLNTDLYQGKRYPLDRDWQMGLLALLARDPGFLATAMDVVHPKFFEFEDLELLSQIVLEYHRRYPKGVCPLGALARAHLRRAAPAPELVSAILATIDRIETMPLPDPAWVLDGIVLFGRRQGLVRATRGILSILSDDANLSLERLNDSQRLVSEALSLGSGRTDNWFFLDAVLDGLPERLQKEVYARRVRTGIPLFDHYLRGGLGPGELGVIMAPPGIGKSMMLVCFAIAAAMGDTDLLLRGESNAVKVLYSTHELKHLNVAARIVANVFGMPVDEIENPTDAVMAAAYQERLRILRTDYGFGKRCGQMVVQHYPPKAATATTLRSRLSYYRNEFGFCPEEVFVDYADELGDEGESRRENSYHALGTIYEDLIRIGEDFGCGVWTASQPNRKGIEKALSGTEVCGMGDAGESNRKIHVARAVITLNQSPAESAMGVLRGFVAKANNGESHKVVDLVQSSRTMRIHESPQQTSQQRMFGDRQGQQQLHPRRNGRGNHTSEQSAIAG